MMKRWFMALIATLLVVAGVWAGTSDTVNPIPGAGASFLTDLQTFLRQEEGDRFAEMFRSFAVSGGTHGTTSGTLTATPTSFIGYAGGYRVTETGSITYDPSTTCYVIFTRSTTVAVTGYTRVSGTHYMIDCAGAQATVPAAAGNLMTVTTNGTEVTAVTDTRALTPIGAAQGGTGFTTFAVGDVLYADTTASLARLAGVATGNALISGGVSTAPSWGKVGLATHISGTLGVGNGGLGITTTPSNGFVPIGNGTNYTAAALTAGTNITISNAAGTVTINSTASSSGSWLVLGNDSSRASTTTYTLSADAVVLRNTSNEVTTRHAPSDVVNDITAAGPAVNGRDQAGAFSANSWVHLYWIWNGTTLGSVSSAVAPPTGPTLPATYTHWAYCCALRLNASTQFGTATIIRDRWVYYPTRQVALANGASATEASIDLAAIVPPNASSVAFTANILSSAAPAAGTFVEFKHTAGADFVQLRLSDLASNNHPSHTTFTAPNVGQALLYQVTAAGATVEVDVEVLGYEMKH